MRRLSALGEPHSPRFEVLPRGEIARTQNDNATVQPDGRWTRWALDQTFALKHRFAPNAGKIDTTTGVRGYFRNS